MSFRCGNCGEPQETYTQPVMVVTQVRKVTYPPVVDERGKIVKVPEGLENVKEVPMCAKCAEEYGSCTIVGEKTIEE